MTGVTAVCFKVAYQRTLLERLFFRGKKGKDVNIDEQRPGILKSEVFSQTRTEPATQEEDLELWVWLELWPQD